MRTNRISALRPVKPTHFGASPSKTDALASCRPAPRGKKKRGAHALQCMPTSRLRAAPGELSPLRPRPTRSPRANFPARVLLVRTGCWEGPPVFLTAARNSAAKSTFRLSRPRPFTTKKEQKWSSWAASTSALHSLYRGRSPPRPRSPREKVVEPPATGEMGGKNSGVGQLSLTATHAGLKGL